jgi:hypothetical protein
MPPSGGLIAAPPGGWGCAGIPQVVPMGQSAHRQVDAPTTTLARTPMAVCPARPPDTIWGAAIETVTNVLQRRRVRSRHISCC